jgi:hypothetical protein
MAAIPGFRGQTNTIQGFRADNGILSITAPQLILPYAAPRSSFVFQNTSTAVMWLEFGSAQGYATVSGGAVTAVTITNAGFGFTYPPRIMFMGGALDPVNGLFLGVGYPGHPGPSHPAIAHAVLTAGAVTSVVIDDGGSGYSTNAPYVLFTNDQNDPYGCANPYVSGSTTGSGFSLGPGGSISEVNSVVTTDQLAVWCGTLGAQFACRWTQ